MTLPSASMVKLKKSYRLLSLQKELFLLLKFSKETNIEFNPSKTKLIVIETKQIAKTEDLDNKLIQVTWKEKAIAPIKLKKNQLQKVENTSPGFLMKKGTVH